MRKLPKLAFVTLAIMGVAGVALGNTVASSTIVLEGTGIQPTLGAGGVVIGLDGVFKCVNGARETALGLGDGVGGFDVYGKEGANAWFGDKSGDTITWTSQTISSHDAWPTWTPDTPDWYQYTLELDYDAGTGIQYWALRNHAGSTESSPHSTLAMGVPMSGWIDMTLGFAWETGLGAYLPGTGTPEIPGGAAGHGGGAGAWDMDWSWGSEVVPLEWTTFAVSFTEPSPDHQWIVTLAPRAVPEPLTLLGLGFGVAAAGAYVRRRRLA